ERQPIAIELLVQLSTSASTGRIDVYDPSPVATQVSSAAKTETRPLALKVGEARIDLLVTTRMPVAFESARSFLLNEFDSADAQMRGFLEKKQIQGNPYLTALLPAAEWNDQRKLSKEEFGALVDLLGKAIGS